MLRSRHWPIRTFKPKPNLALSSVRNKFSSFTTALNHYQLQGAGLWLGSSVNSGLGQTDFKLTWARRIGHNPNANSSGLDQDGSLVLNRYLFNINHAF